jgi:Fe-S oxidoreductase
MLYFRGCVVREKLPGIGMATQQILDKSGTQYDILDEENCCGSFLLRTGFKDDALELMKNTLKDLEGKKIVVSCAGCYNTLKNDYKELFGVELDVKHTSTLFNELIKQGKLKPKELFINICYHDPCHLGRQCGEYESPREVLRSIVNLVEMENIKENSDCCGAGGGVKSAHPEIAIELGQKRIEEAISTNADILVTTCSFCLMNLQDACKSKLKKELPVMDLSELLLWALTE